MKICIICRLFNPYIIGGGEIVVERLAIALGKDNEVFVISTKPFDGLNSLFPKKEIYKNLRIYRFYPLNLYNTYFTKKRKIPLMIKIIWHMIDLFNLHTFWAILNILKKEKPDIIHTQGLEGLSFSVFWVAKFLKIPLVHTLHSYHLLCPYANLICPYTKFNICKNRPFPCKIYSLFKKLIINSIPKIIIGPSKFVIDIHKRYSFFKKISTQIIPNFIEIQNKEIVFNKINKETLDVLYIGRLSKEKGVDILIGAFKSIKEGFCRLHIVGDGPEKRKLEILVAEDKRIKFYGMKNLSEVKEFYLFCDLLVMPSICYESFALVVLEAFSFGIPVIGSRIGAISELIENGYNGFLFIPRDKEELQQKIQIFIDDFNKDKYLLKIFSKNAYAKSEKYRKDYISPQIFNIYQRLVKRENGEDR